METCRSQQIVDCPQLVPYHGRLRFPRESRYSISTIENAQNIPNSAPLRGHLRFEENMSSVASFASIAKMPSIHEGSVRPPSEPMLRAQSMEIRHVTLSRLSKIFESGTPEEWLLALGADLRGLLEFDNLDIYIYKPDSGEIEWRSSTRGRFAPPETPMEDFLFRHVFQRQSVIRIAECIVDVDDSCAKS
jgi:hypothetical protein